VFHVSGYVTFVFDVICNLMFQEYRGTLARGGKSAGKRFFTTLRFHGFSFLSLLSSTLGSGNSRLERGSKVSVLVLTFLLAFFRSAAITELVIRLTRGQVGDDERRAWVMSHSSDWRLLK
jgi:hypothetical protein